MLFAFLIQEKHKTFMVSSSLKAQQPFHWWQIPQHQSHQDQTERKTEGNKNNDQNLPNAVSGAVPL